MAACDMLIPSLSRIVVLQRSGQVAAEIVPAIPPEEVALIGDVAYAGPDRLYVTNYSGEIWTIDFTGAVVAGPLETGLLGFEGIATTTTGAVVALAFPQSLLAFDAALNRVPDNDRFDVVGLGVDNAMGAAWNSETDQFLVSHNLATTSSDVRIAAVEPSFGAASTYFVVPGL